MRGAQVICVPLIAALLGSVTGDVDYLPFMLSSDTCDVGKHLSPMCTCTTKLQINDFDGFCRSHEELVSCLWTEVSADDSSMTAKIFDHEQAMMQLPYLCGLYTKLRPKLSSCSYQAWAKSCDNSVINPKQLAGVNFTIPKWGACRTSHDYSQCYWHVNCTGNDVKHFMSSIVEFYTSVTCAKHNSSFGHPMAISEKCNNLGESLYPEERKVHNQCINQLHTMKQCFIRLKLELSEHPADKLHNAEFDLNRYEQYRLFRCDIEKERNHECSYKKRKKQKVCFARFSDYIDMQVDRIKNGTQVTSGEICKIYDNVTQCMTDLFTDCPVESVYFNSILCASMPTSCHCPVDLKRERIARLSGSSNTYSPVLLMATLVIVALTVKPR